MRARKIAAVASPEPLLKLDLGCGQHPKEGFLGVDIYHDAKIVSDLSVAPWTFWVDDTTEVPGDRPAIASRKYDQDIRGRHPVKPADASVGEVFSSHFIEHLSGPQRIIFFNELYRVMAPGAQATFIFPYYSSVRAIQDPTHAWPPIADASFLYWNKGWRKANGLDHYPIQADFDFVPSYSVAQPWASKHEEVRAMAMNSYLNAIPDGQVVMTRRPSD